MADENIDLDSLDQEIEKENKVEKRIKDLSDKVRLTSEERDEQKKLVKEQADRIANLEKENTFNSGFADVLSTHPNAKDYKDKIKEKVMAGYSVDDATYAVLGKEGKLGQSEPVPQSTPPRENPAGGSSITNMPEGSGKKSMSELSRDEKREQLLEAERRGDISLT